MSDAQILWPVLKTLLNNKKSLAFHLYHTKIILLLVSKKKPRCLIIFSCSIPRNKSELNATPSKKKKKEKEKTRESLTAIDFSNDDILKVIRNLHPNKGHDHDMINIRTGKICHGCIFKSLFSFQKYFIFTL